MKRRQVTRRGRLIGRAMAWIVAAAALALWTPEAAAERSYKVKRGDTLGEIAHEHGCSVAELARANDIDRDLIRVGQSLTIPSCDGGSRDGRLGTITHTVIAGDTLSGIASRYGVSMDHIVARNRSLRAKDAVLRVGQKLEVRPTKPVQSRHKITYRIQAGDTLSRIAARYDLSVSEIARMNPRKKPNALRIGDRLTLWIEGPENPSVSVGRPQAGRLVNGEQLPRGPSWYRRRPHRAWGTNETVRNLVAAFQAVRRAHPDAHDIAVGDLSAKDGGRLANHVSHQTGRDADIGFYFKGQPRHGPKAFLNAHRHYLDYPATWTLVETLAGESPEKSRVEYMFLDYGVQKKIYEWAKDNGVSKRTLAWMFQYPRGRRAMRGMIRHEPGHAGHIHVRFKCARGDDGCK